MSFQIPSVRPVVQYVTIGGTLYRTADEVCLPSSRNHPTLNTFRYQAFTMVVKMANHEDWLTRQGVPQRTRGMERLSNQEWKEILTPELVSAFFVCAAHNRDLIGAIVKNKEALGEMEPFIEDGDFERADKICNRLELPKQLDDVTDVQLISAIRIFYLGPSQ